MLEPSLPFCVCLFGAMQTGAISVPMFTLFGPDALRSRNCRARVELSWVPDPGMIPGPER